MRPRRMAEWVGSEKPEVISRTQRQVDMKKIRLFTPGPTMVPEDVMLEMARPMEHHRTAWYRDMHRELCGLLQYLFQTKATCLTFTGSGTAAMEAAIVGCTPPGHKALASES